MSDPGSLEIRPLAGHSEYRSCLALQRLVWGGDFSDCVPPSLLWAAQRAGGFADGAFRDGELVGFTFGFAGSREGAPFHWLDMIAVHPRHRGRGVGRALLEHARAVLLARGATLLEWTFEPLESGLAWLYFHRLGATAREYLRDVYGDSDSVLHRGLGTDRLVVQWQLRSERAVGALAGNEPASGGAAVTPISDVAWQGEWPRSGEPRLGQTGRSLALPIPADIQQLKAAEPALARAWRHVVRTALEHYLGRGWLVADVQRVNARVSSYILLQS